MEDFAKLMGQMKEAQAGAQEIQQKLARLQATGEAGAGAVTATVNGHKSLLKLAIEQEYINADEKGMLQDLIVAAVNLANKAVEEKIQEEVKQHTQGMLGGLPIDLMM
ncbi:MAG: YbaB/EbfC family nucleoid-associated protein [Bacteroidota bacterium]